MTYSMRVTHLSSGLWEAYCFSLQGFKRGGLGCLSWGNTCVVSAMSDDGAVWIRAIIVRSKWVDQTMSTWPINPGDR